MLYFQTQTIRMMYKIVGDAMRDVGITEEHPRDYLIFLTIGEGCAWAAGLQGLWKHVSSLNETLRICKAQYEQAALAVTEACMLIKEVTEASQVDNCVSVKLSGATVLACAQCLYAHVLLCGKKCSALPSAHMEMAYWLCTPVSQYKSGKLVTAVQHHQPGLSTLECLGICGTRWLMRQ